VTTALIKKRRWLRWLGIILFAGAAFSVWFVWWCLPGTHVVDHDVALPIRYQAGLLYAEPVTLSGQKMSLLLDTGGGTFVTRRCAERCGVRATLPFGIGPGCQRSYRRPGSRSRPEARNGCG
jgi:hypothetical protein